MNESEEDAVSQICEQFQIILQNFQQKLAWFLNVEPVSFIEFVISVLTRFLQKLLLSKLFPMVLKFLESTSQNFYLETAHVYYKIFYLAFILA